MTVPRESTRTRSLSWVEPKGFRKAELKGSWKSVARMCAAAVIAAAIAGYLAVRLGLGFQAVTGTLAAAGGIVVMCLVMWGVAHVTRITVKITDKAIVWYLGETATKYRLDAIHQCEVCLSDSASVVSTLVIWLENGDREEFAIAPSVPIEVLRYTLEQRGVTVITSTAPHPTIGGSE